jgi:hypothetical protein
LQVRDVKLLGKPAIDRHQQGVGFGPFPLLLPELRQAHGRAQLPGFGLLTAGQSQGLLAAELFSPPLVPDGDNVLNCYLVNVREQVRKATIQVFNRSGVAVTTVETTLSPGQEDVARADASLLPRYCRFEVDGKRSHFRASVLIRQDSVGAISALPAE